ncbi:MAG: thioredoxin domain-containing protein [Bifidobacteriaceae bacterium]|nr:thioredoxin domain-containing protein [Bifidobacteriaceae bacterium]
MANAKKKPDKAQDQQRRQAAARAEAERLKAAQAAKERRTKLIAVAAAVVVVIAVAVAVVLVLRGSNKSSYEDVTRPLGGSEAGAIVVGQDLAAGGAPAEGDDVVVVRIYSDYMCPGCGSVERRLGAKLEELTASGDIKLELQSVAYLNRFSQGTEYSTRAANATATVAALAPEQYLAFHSKLYESGVQPEESTEGLTDERLVELAQEVGVPESVTSQFAERKYESWVDYATTQAQDFGVGGTPSIWVGKSDSDLTQITDTSSLNLDAVIAAVRAGDNPNG